MPSPIIENGVLFVWQIPASPLPFPGATDLERRPSASSFLDALLRQHLDVDP